MPHAAEEPVWRMIARTPECVLMTYQLPERVRDVVLREDLAKLESMRRRQPQFSAGQRAELAGARAWAQSRGLPPGADTHGCASCRDRAAGSDAGGTCGQDPGPRRQLSGGEVPSTASRDISEPLTVNDRDVVLER